MQRRHYLRRVGASVGGGVAVGGVERVAAQSAGFVVAIEEVFDPVRAGDVLVVRTGVENTAMGMDEQVIRLVVSDEVVDTESVPVPGGEPYPVPVELAYETYPVEEDVEFPVRVECDDDADEQRVAVVTEADGELVPVIDQTNAPVKAGDVLRMRGHIGNTGRVTQTQDVRLVVGDETVDSEPMTVPRPHEYGVTLSYETYPVEQDVEFPVRVETEDDAAQTAVRVLADVDLTFDVRIDRTNAPVNAGDVLEVEATVTNTGGVAGAQEVRLVVGGETVDRETVEIPAGFSNVVWLGYETYPVEQTVEFPVRVETAGGADERVVTVYGVG
ncbi:hypothetical protein [Salinilacihabitans rarus]|uniref:hypothetical protein n=1 Tax=Salinilacihabitans rarus TaxID=2961596 RepID=UPI0020C86AB7|nr:hypothetical protein [Salinilacihabitans rarus]